VRPRLPRWHTKRRKHRHQALPHAGAATLTATAGADQIEPNTTNNAATATVQVDTPPTPTPVPPPPRTTLAPPTLKKTSARSLSIIRRRTVEIVSGKIATNEPLRLTITVTKLHSTTRLPLRKGSSLAGPATTKTAVALTRFITHAGPYSFHADLTRHALRKGARYLIHLAARNANGKTKTLTIGFTA
jgi:hypothetical protein